MFIVSKALLISSATVIVHAGGAIWLNPFATVLLCVLIGLYEVPLFVSLLGFGIGTMLATVMCEVLCFC